MLHTTYKTRSLSLRHPDLGNPPPQVVRVQSQILARPPALELAEPLEHVAPPVERVRVGPAERQERLIDIVVVQFS